MTFNIFLFTFFQNIEQMKIMDLKKLTEQRKLSTITANSFQTIGEFRLQQIQQEEYRKRMEAENYIKMEEAVFIVDPDKYKSIPNNHINYKPYSNLSGPPGLSLISNKCLSPVRKVRKYKSPMPEYIYIDHTQSHQPKPEWNRSPTNSVFVNDGMTKLIKSVNDLPALIPVTKTLAPINHDFLEVNHNNKMRITIIGTTGIKKGDGKFCTLANFQNMITQVEKFILKSGVDWNNIEFNCSGLTFSDHIGIMLSLNYGCKLNLYLNDYFREGAFVDNDTLTREHRFVSRKLGVDSLDDIENVVKLRSTNALVVTENHNRNKLLCKADKLIVFKINNDDIMDENTTLVYEKFSEKNRIVLSINELTMVTF